MHMGQFSKINRMRCEAANGFNKPLNAWTLSDWMTATVGELGEAANVIKKLLRHYHGQPGNSGKDTESALRSDLADELADTFTYLNLLSQAAGIDLEQAVIAKFNKVSARVGFDVKILPNGDFE